MDELDEKVLDIQQRQKRAQIMRRYKSKIERAREIAKKRMAPEANIRKRAFVQARQIIRRRVAGARGAEYEKLGPSEKIAIDRAVEGKQKLIKKLALRLIPRVKQAEAKRLHSFMKGQSIQNQGQPEGKSKESSGSSSVKESLNHLFVEAFPPTATSTALGQKVDSPISQTNGKKMPKKGESKNSDIIQYNKFQEEVEFDTPAFAALFKKSEKSGIDLETLGEVYNRGWNSWTEGLKVTQEQYAFARVNSFINQGKTYFNEDADLHEGTMKPYVKPHYGDPNKPDKQTGWKSANKHGKTKYWQMFAKSSAEKHAGVDKINEEAGPSYKEELPRILKDIRGKRKGHSDLRREYGSNWKRLANATSAEHGPNYKREHLLSVGKKHMEEEVSHTNENFMDGKGPGRPGDSARHGLKGKSAAELRKIRSSETASPRKKQLAHWLLNMHHNEETELDEKRGLWDNIHAKRRRIKAGSGERMRKPGSKGAPTAQDFRDAQESVQEAVSLDTDHYKALTDIELNTKNRDMTTKNDGYGPLNPLDEKGSKKFWEEKAKMWKTTVEAAKEARCGNCAFFNQSPPVMKKIADGIGVRGETVSEHAGFGFCEIWEFKCAAQRTCNTWVLGGPIKEDTGNGTQLVDKQSRNSKLRKRIEKVDRATPHTEHGKQQEIQKKIIDEKLGNVQKDPKKRLIGTDSLVKAYKADTPFSENLDESFNIAFASGVGVTLTARDLGMEVKGGFALHPSVVEQMEEQEVEEEVRSADVKGVIVRTTNPDGTPGKTVIRRQKANRKIIGTGNLTDGKPDDTL